MLGQQYRSATQYGAFNRPPVSSGKFDTGTKTETIRNVEDTMQNVKILTPGGFKPLSKEQREEAARVAAETGFSFEGYQVVRREFFSHKYEPTIKAGGSGIRSVPCQPGCIEIGHTALHGGSTGCNPMVHRKR